MDGGRPGPTLIPCFRIYACRALYDGNRFLVLPTALFAMQHDVCFPDFRFATTPMRALKYDNKGYSYLVPVSLGIASLLGRWAGAVCASSGAGMRRVLMHQELYMHHHLRWLLQNRYPQSLVQCLQPNSTISTPFLSLSPYLFPGSLY